MTIDYWIKMTIQKTIRTKDHYELKCPKCNKVVNGWSLKQVRHNYKIHEMFCKGGKNNGKN